MTLAGSLRPTKTTVHAVDVDDVGPVELTVADRDRTRPWLLLHSGGGTDTMSGFADLLAERTHARVLLPTHPGFDGTTRPDGLDSVAKLAKVYVALLEELDLSDVTVLGNSLGGWVAAEIALLESPRVSGVVILDGVGIEVDGHPVTDPSGLSAEELRAKLFHDPQAAPPLDRGGVPDLAAEAGYAKGSSDPSLLDRLKDLQLPFHVVWGESDGILDRAYGQAWADTLPVSAFTVLPGAGHFPQVEVPEQLLGALLDLGTTDTEGSSR